MRLPKLLRANKDRMVRGKINLAFEDQLDLSIEQHKQISEEQIKLMCEEQNIKTKDALMMLIIKAAKEAQMDSYAVFLANRQYRQTEAYIDLVQELPEYGMG